MGQCNHLRVRDEFRRREVGHVSMQLAAVQCRQGGIVIDNTVSRKIDQHGPIVH